MINYKLVYVVNKHMYSRLHELIDNDYDTDDDTIDSDIYSNSTEVSDALESDAYSDNSDNSDYSYDDSGDSEYSVISGGAKAKAKWETLIHSGVMFYPAYESHGVPMKYDGTEIILNDEAEEFASYYVNPRYDKYKNKKFNANFFKDWRTVLSDKLQSKIKDFDKCDFSAIKKHVIKDMEKKKEERTNKSKEQKAREKEEKEAETSQYKVALVNGKEQIIDNFMVEPPSIFMGRGEHPLSGSLKKRIYPEDVTLNIGPKMSVPEVTFNGETRNWGEIISDNTLEWIASWQNSVTNKTNYARFGRKSDFKMKSDETKFDLARKLKYRIKKIRDENDENLEDDDSDMRQLATALFLIDRLALRAGNEKKRDEADTVGVTTLKVKNVTLFDDKKHVIKLDFLGKDSIRYVNKFVVPVAVYNNFREFTKGKKGKDSVFDEITSDTLNKYIKGFMKKLTSKVFRTYNASNLMQIELRKIVANMKGYEDTDRLKKIKYMYDMANIKVAALCNHQKMSTTDNTKRIDDMNEKIHKVKLEINKLNRQKRKKIDEKKSTKAINKRIESKKKKMTELKNRKKLIEEGKNLSVGTSKTNYIDPRITIAFLKKMDLMESIDKFFNKTQQKNFEWAMDIDEQYSF